MLPGDLLEDVRGLSTNFSPCGLYVASGVLIGFIDGLKPVLCIASGLATNAHTNTSVLVLATVKSTSKPCVGHLSRWALDYVFKSPK